MISSLASDRINQDLVGFYPIEDPQVSVAKLEFELPGGAVQAEAVSTFHGRIVLS